MPIRLIVLGAVCCVFLAGCNREEASEGDNEIQSSGVETAMILTLSSDEKVANPSNDKIRECLGSLSVGRDGEGFAILGPDEMTYIQVTGDKTVGFDMEYQEGHLGKHYRAEREDFTLDEVIRAFSEYRDGGIDWSAYGDWSRITW